MRPAEMALPALFRNVTNDAGAPAITTMYAFRSDAFVAEMYLGLFVVLLAAAGILAGSRGAGAALAAVVVSILFAAGEHTPLLKFLYDIHLFRSIRYPEKFILTAALALIVWAALLFDRLLAGDKRLLRVATVVASIWLVIVAIAAAAKPAYFGWQVLRAVVVLHSLVLIRRKPVAIAVIVLTIADLWLATRALVPRMPRAYFDPPPIVAQRAAEARTHLPRRLLAGIRTRSDRDGVDREQIRTRLLVADAQHPRRPSARALGIRAGHGRRRRPHRPEDDGTRCSRR